MFLFQNCLHSICCCINSHDILPYLFFEPTQPISESRLSYLCWVHVLSTHASLKTDPAYHCLCVFAHTAVTDTFVKVKVKRQQTHETRFSIWLCVVSLLSLSSLSHVQILAHMHTNTTHPETHCNRRAPPMLCSHVERPEQLGASVSQRLDLLPRAGMEERLKRVRGGERGQWMNYRRYTRKC